jgi:DNA-binding response OmpR family regulator
MSTRILVIDDSPTLRKVVCAILERNGYAAVAASDGQSGLDLLRGAGGFDLVLVDFVMPRMNGYQFCQAVRADEILRGVPIVLMSAKGDRIREQFVQQTAAIDAITKPFDAQALVAVIEHALYRVAQAGGRFHLDTRQPDEAPAISLRGAALDLAVRASRVAADVSQKLARVLAPRAANGPWRDVDEDQLAAMLAPGLNPDVLRELGRALADLPTADRAALVMWGDMSFVPTGAILQMLHVERQTGVLELRRPAFVAGEDTAPARVAGQANEWRAVPGGSEVTITWRNGLVDFVQSRGAGDEFRLGRFLIEQGLVTPAEIDELLRRPDSTSATSRPPPLGGRPPAKLLLGDVLVQSGRVTDADLKAALSRQASELIYEVLRWRRGHFELRRQQPSPQAERARLGLPVASVIMEGFRRVDEWRVVEATLGSFESVLQRDPMAVQALGTDRIARPERLVLDTIDGERTIREIVAASHLSSFDACRILGQLLEARVVRRRAEA